MTVIPSVVEESLASYIQKGISPLVGRDDNAHMQLTIHTDGGSRGNPGPSALGVVVESSSNSLVWEHSRFLGIGTNNNAEYTAVIDALSWLKEQTGIESVQFCLDSQLVVSQLNGVYQVKHPAMRTLKMQVDSLRSSLPYPVRFMYVPRAQNAAADALVNKELDRN